MGKHPVQPALEARVKMMAAEVRLGRKFDKYESIYISGDSATAVSYDLYGLNFLLEHFVYVQDMPAGMLPGGTTRTKCDILLDLRAHHKYPLAGFQIELCRRCLQAFVEMDLAEERQGMT